LLAALDARIFSSTFKLLLPFMWDISVHCAVNFLSYINTRTTAEYYNSVISGVGIG
jgi:hypothetical protein